MVTSPCWLSDQPARFGVTSTYMYNLSMPGLGGSVTLYQCNTHLAVLAYAHHLTLKTARKTPDGTGDSNTSYSCLHFSVPTCQERGQESIADRARGFLDFGCAHVIRSSERHPSKRGLGVDLRVGRSIFTCFVFQAIPGRGRAHDMKPNKAAGARESLTPYAVGLKHDIGSAQAASPTRLSGRTIARVPDGPQAGPSVW